MKFTTLLKAVAIILFAAAVIVYPTCPLSDEYGEHDISQCEEYHGSEITPYQLGIGGGGMWVG
ncbi:MAG: hypothetical protein R3Y57_02965 [Erysipelotrichaceae bacterium]